MLGPPFLMLMLCLFGLLLLAIFQVTNQDCLLQLIGSRFTELRVIELATDLITPNVLHELAARCPQLWSMTLGKTSSDF